MKDVSERPLPHQFVQPPAPALVVFGVVPFLPDLPVQPVEFLLRRFFGRPISAALHGLKIDTLILGVALIVLLCYSL